MMVEGGNDRIGTRVLMGTVAGVRLQRVSDGLWTLKLTLPGGYVQTLDARGVQDVRAGATEGECEIWTGLGVVRAPLRWERTKALVEEIREEMREARRRERLEEVDLSGLLTQREVRALKGCSGRAVTQAARDGQLTAVPVRLGLREVETRYRRDEVEAWMPVRREAPHSGRPVGTMGTAEIAMRAGCSVCRVRAAMDGRELETVERSSGGKRPKRYVVRSSADAWVARMRKRASAEGVGA